MPDDEITPETMLVAHRPIYSTKVAGRGLPNKFRNDIVATGLEEYAVMRALYYEQVDGGIQVTTVTRR